MTKTLYKYKGGSPMTTIDKIDYIYCILKDYMCAGLSEKTLKKRYLGVHPDTIKYIIYSKEFEPARNRYANLNRLKFENKFRKEE